MKSAWVVPVFRANVAAVWPTSNVENDSQDDVPDDGNDFDDRKNKLSLAVPFHTEEVDDDYQREEYCDPGVVVYTAFAPVVDGQGRCNNLKREHYKPLHGIAEIRVSMRIDSIISRHHTHFHPIAKPHAGSRNLVEYAAKEPEIGKSTAISPNACTVQYIIIPMREKAMVSDAGPPDARALPDPTKRPVPIEPPIAIICR